VFNFKRFIAENIENIDVNILFSFFELSMWDPKIFVDSDTIIIDRSRGFTEAQKNYLLYGLSKVLDNIYPLPESRDGYFVIGRIFYYLGAYLKALECFDRSIHHYGYRSGTHYNIGLCLLLLGKTESAYGSFKLVSKTDPTETNTIEWLRILENEIKPDIENIKKNKTNLFNII
jgi:tetratricopeptide (TPR) repeat protein